MEKQAGDKQAPLNPSPRTGWFEFIPFFLILCCPILPLRGHGVKHSKRL